MLSPEEIQEALDVVDLVEEHVNAGGQKVVYPCSIEGSRFALKVIELPPIAGEEDEANRESIGLRVRREIEIMREIENPHLVRPGPMSLEQITVGDNDYFCFTEEWIDGQDLAEHCQENGNLSLAACLKMASQVNGVIGELWERSFLHRDISMKNVMMRDDGDYVLIDLGYAFDFLGVSLTQHPGPPGTLHFMAPERFDLSKKRELDHRSDQFSLGVVSFAALTGQHPYYQLGMSGDDYVRELCNGTNAPAAPSSLLASDLAPATDRFIIRLISRHRHMRFPTCVAVQREIESILEDV
jgi:serine/threonine-protein kinase